MPPLTRNRSGRTLTREELAQGLELRRMRLRRRRIVELAGAACLSLALVAAELSGLIDHGIASADAALREGLVTVGLTVDSVKVEGRRRTDMEDLRAAMDVSRGDSLLHLDLDAMRERVESLGWVRSANLYRSLPNRLNLDIEERQAFAIWQYEGDLKLIDREGSVITSAHLDNFSSLPLVVGKGAADDAAELEAMLAAEPELAANVASAIRVGDRRWNIRFKSGVEARLPQDNPAGAWTRLAALEREHALLERDILHVDMRLGDRLIVRQRELTVNFKGPKQKI